MLAVLFTGFSSSAVLTHQIAYFVSVGFAREMAGYLVLILSISNIAGRFGFGWLGDYISPKTAYLIAAIVLLSGLAMLAYAGSFVLAVAAGVLLGAGLGAVTTLRSVMQLGLFGRKAFAAIQGLLLSALTCGSILSPTFAGWIFDNYATYRPAWLTLAALSFLAIPLILSIPRQTPSNRPAPSWR